ncbi:hypothetical protein E2C01_100363 [Portunus trituberculatus]|uniref:Uncharacterized protein n=1 Tax=Portunus trituberculatus TaxID=210409 RepID=A0A5B7KJA6_PORTR|nr:hypothetical protein [Portunus trituberculatus]
MRNSSNMVLLTFFGFTLADRVNVGPINLRTTPSATSRSVGAGGPVHLANRLALLTDDSVESPARSDENNTDLTKQTHVLDVHLPLASPKLLKSMTKRHHGSAESLDLAQPKQSKVSPGAHNRKSSRNRSTRVALVVSVQPPVKPCLRSGFL